LGNKLQHSFDLNDPDHDVSEMSSPIPDMASSGSALITDSGQGIGSDRGGQAG